jgi:hypothetical protein
MVIAIAIAIGILIAYCGVYARSRSAIRRHQNAHGQSPAILTRRSRRFLVRSLLASAGIARRQAWKEHATSGTENPGQHNG